MRAWNSVKKKVISKMAGKQPKRLPREGMDEYGRSPLHYAALRGNLAEVKQLISEGAQIDMQDDNGITALHFAVQDQRIDVVEFLLSLNANPNLLNQHGNGPLWTAVLSPKDKTEIMEMLLAQGANAKQVNKNGNSPCKLANDIIKNGVILSANSAAVEKTLTKIANL
jgi:uncharacterized protein